MQLGKCEGSIDDGKGRDPECISRLREKGLLQFVTRLHLETQEKEKENVKMHFGVGCSSSQPRLLLAGPEIRTDWDSGASGVTIDWE